MGNSDWFKGFEKGIAKLTAEQREQFFSECGKNCVNGGTLSVYRKLMRTRKVTWMFSFKWQMIYRE